MEKKTIDTKDLEQLLNGLYSDEGRAIAVFRLVARGFRIAPKYITKAIKYYEKAGRFDAAAYVAEEAGLAGRAKQLRVKAISAYEKAGRFDAACFAKKAGLTERAIDNYEKAGDFEKAAHVAKEAGLTERAKRLRVKAIDAYEKKGWFYDAAHVAEEAGMTEKAKLYEDLERLLEQ